MFEAVLFDWRGTLFTDEPEAAWIRNTAAGIGRLLDDGEIARILDDALALAIWQRDGEPDASFPFADTQPVLRSLRERGLRIAVVSDIHYDIRDHFRHHALDRYIDASVLSYECGCQKPDAAMFARALDALAVTADRALMVGDRASHDGGAREPRHRDVHPPRALHLRRRITAWPRRRPTTRRTRRMTPNGGPQREQLGSCDARCRTHTMTAPPRARSEPCPTPSSCLTVSR